MRKHIAMLMIISIVAIQLLPILDTKKVDASVVIPADTENYYYVGNNIDLDAFTIDDVLSIENYNQYFDTLSGTDKTNITNKFVLYTGNVYGQRLVNDIVYNDYVVNNGNTINSCYFSSIQINGEIIPIDKCYKMINLMGNYHQMDRTVLFSLFYSPTGDEIVASGDGIYSSAPFYYSFQNFTFEYVTDNDINHFAYYIAGGNHGVQATFDSTDNVYKYVFNNDYQGVVYCDMVYLFTSTSFTDIKTNVKSYNAYINDTSNLAVDRRTKNFIDITDDSGNVSPDAYGFKKGSFGNILYGGAFDNQKLMVGYELNDASKSIQNQLALKLNYRYIFDGEILSQEILYDEDYYDNANRYDVYSLQDTNYINVDLSKIFNYMYENDGNYAENLGIVQSSIERRNNFNGYPTKILDRTPLYLMKTLKDEGVLVQYQNNVSYNDAFFDSVSITYKDVTVSPKFNFNTIFEGEYSQEYTNTINNVQLIVTESILNLQTGEESAPYTFIYNYVDGTYNSIGTLETEGEVFDNKYSYGSQSLSSYTSDDINFDVSKGEYYPSTNAFGGSSSASVGDVIVYAGSQTVSKVFIDMPLEEALDHTPNLATLYGDMKNALVVSTDESGSMLDLMKESYTFIPAEIWGYITICVVTCCGLAVYRNFRGR